MIFIKTLLNKPTIFYIALLLLILIVFNKPNKNIENFLTYGDYPKDTIYPLLHGDYLLKKKNYGQVSKNNYSDNYEYYPIYSSDSLKINNIRYWKKPDNGKCSTADFCDVLYEENEPDRKPSNISGILTGMNDEDDYDEIDVKVRSPQPEWGIERVNYYESNISNVK
jgi:hypothetical protein